MAILIALDLLHHVPEYKITIIATIITCKGQVQDWSRGLKNHARSCVH